MNQPDPTTPALQPLNAEGFTAQLEQLLEQLVPPEGLTLTLVDGSQLALPVMLPARRQVRAFRVLRELLEHASVQKAFGTVKAGGTSGIVDALVVVATDEKVAELLGKVFLAAYPDALQDDPLELLSLEELVRAILPFTGRFLGQLGKGMGSVMGLMESASA